MSLRPTAPEFQPYKSLPSSKDDTNTYNKAARVLTPSLLGYEFPYTMKEMPINIIPTKRVWSEMAIYIPTYFGRLY